MTTAFDTFAIVRDIAATPARVFQAFADQGAKDAWFHGPEGDAPSERRFDFRVGGTEVLAGTMPEGWTHRFEATYQDIVADERIVYTYLMFINGIKLSVSQTTVELEPTATGTRVTFTEQGAYLAADEVALGGGITAEESRRMGSEQLMDALQASLEG